MIYLDYHAATPLAPGVAEAMARARECGWANPASAHAPGRAARRALEAAREQIASAIGAHPADVVCTSGGTEACNLGILGVDPPCEVVTWRIAHPAVLRSVEQWADRGVSVSYVDGVALPKRFASGALVVVPWVNHECGTVIDVDTVVGLAVSHGARVMLDASQALGRISIHVSALPIESLAISAHKIGGPAGAGALWVRRGASLTPRSLGGGQERGRRGGSPAVASVAGFGAACAAVPARLQSMTMVGTWRDRLEAAAVGAGARVNGVCEGASRVASVTNVSFPGWRADHLVAALDLEGVAVSAGAACSSGLGQPSPTVAELHPEEPWRAQNAVRFSLGPEALEPDDIERAAALLASIAARGAPADGETGG